MPSSQPRPQLLASAMAGQFLFGITLALFGTLFGIPAVTGALRLDLSSQANLLVVLFSGQMLCTAVAGRLVDRFGSLHLLAAGAGLLASSLALVGLAGGVGLALVAAGLMSIGGAAVNAGSNVLVSTACGERRQPMLNVVALFGALGAIAVPLVFAGTTTIGGARTRLFGLAAFGAVSGAAHLLQPDPGRGREEPGESPKTRRILLDGRIAALVVLLILDFGMESIAAGWISTYTIGTLAGASGTAMVGIYWTALMLGRLAGPALHARMAKLPIVAAAAVVVAISFAGVSVAPDVRVLGVVVALVGLALGPMGPTVLSVAGDRYTRGTGAVFGIMLSLGQIGSVVLPWTVAQVAAASGFRTAMLVPAMSATLLALVAGGLWMRMGARGDLRPAEAGTP